jgi:hypothetical protein
MTDERVRAARAGAATPAAKVAPWTTPLGALGVRVRGGACDTVHLNQSQF